jgi:hypothetical protein
MIATNFEVHRSSFAVDYTRLMIGLWYNPSATVHTRSQWTMTPNDKADPNSPIPLEIRMRIHRLADALLERYNVSGPPVPVERMLTDPLLDLWKTDPTQMSAIMGHGMFRYAPRLAQARLLYRTISESDAARSQGLDAPWPVTRREVKYFSRYLLMPAAWVRRLPETDQTPERIGEIFQVPTFDAIVRVGELGLPVPGGGPAPTDE